MIMLPLLLAAGCDGGLWGEPPATNATARPSCAPAEDIEDLIWASWRDVPAGRLHTRCLVMRTAHGERWLIDAFGRPPDGSVARWTAVVAPPDDVRWSADGIDDYSFPALGDPVSAEWTIADLDGDGADEVLHVEGVDGPRWRELQLRVATIVDDELIHVRRNIPLATPLELDCDPSWALVPDRARTQVVVHRDPDSCAPPQQLRFRMDAGQLTDTRPPAA